MGHPSHNTIHRLFCSLFRPYCTDAHGKRKNQSLARNRKISSQGEIVQEPQSPNRADHRSRLGCSWQRDVSICVGNFWWQLRARHHARSSSRDVASQEVPPFDPVVHRTNRSDYPDSCFVLWFSPFTVRHESSYFYPGSVGGWSSKSNIQTARRIHKKSWIVVCQWPRSLSWRRLFAVNFYPSSSRNMALDPTKAHYRWWPEYFITLGNGKDSSLQSDASKALSRSKVDSTAGRKESFNRCWLRGPRWRRSRHKSSLPDFGVAAVFHVIWRRSHDCWAPLAPNI